MMIESVTGPFGLTKHRPVTFNKGNTTATLMIVSDIIDRRTEARVFNIQQAAIQSV